MSRIEKQLQKINGDDVEIEEPQSRIEKQLAYILGADIVLEEPQSRIEELVQQIIDNGGGGGGGGSSDFSIAHVTLINTSQDGYYSFSTIRVEGDYIDSYEVSVGTSETITIDVILYKGVQYMSAWEWDTSIAPVITGGITFDVEENLFTITGDGSISLVGTGRMV